MALTKANLIKSICDSTDLTKQESLSTVDSFFEVIKRSLESEEDVMISGFGRFCVKDKKERRGRNPQTGDDMMMDARRIVTFKCSNIMKAKMNGKG